MATYQVVLRTMAFCSVEVEAIDEDEANDKAAAMDMPALCAQCAGWGRDWMPSLELSDVWETDGVYVVDADEPN